MNRLIKRMEETLPQIESELGRILPKDDMVPESLHEAMRYCTLGGGKRMRALLCIFAAEACGFIDGRIIPVACSLEFIHAYSLAHDDLPCMDDADMRRGKLSCHKAFGEAASVLTGDALQALAFEVLAERAPEKCAGRACAILASASGHVGMVGGQVLDLDGEGKELSLDQIEAIDRWKTGALIDASCRIGGVVGGGEDGQVAALSSYAKALGIMYQITDDLLDLECTTEELGKPAGRDEVHEKATYPAALGTEEARELAREKTLEAKNALKDFGKEALMLRLLADYILERKK